MEISTIENGEIFKELTGINNVINSNFLYFSIEKESYLKIFDLLVDIINFYGQISVVGLGEECNPYDKSQLLIDKIGFFGQYGYKGFSRNNKLNLKTIFENEKIYFSHYVGYFNDEETFYKLIHNKTDRVYSEIIKGDFNLELKKKEKYIGIDSKFSIRILFGFDLNENLYLILNGNIEYLEEIRQNVKAKFEFDDIVKKNTLSRITYLERDFFEVEEIFNFLNI